MSSTFDALNDHLASCLPQITAIDWTQFGTNLRNEDVNGIPKGMGVLLMYGGSQIVRAQLRQHNFLRNPEASAQTVVAKAQLLHDNPHAWASMELRDPGKNLWGGGIRLRSGELFAITGLPEIGDHAVLTILLLKRDLLDAQMWAALSSSETPHMHAAMEHVGMTERQYTHLWFTLNSILE